MGKGKALNEIEKGKILAYSESGLSLREIGRKLGRTHEVVRRFLKNPAEYGKKKSTGRKKLVSERTARRIVNCASNSTNSCMQIKRTLDLNVSKSTVWRVLNNDINIIRSKMNVAPRLLEHHKSTRLEFGRKNMSRNWNNVSYFKEPRVLFFIIIFD